VPCRKQEKSIDNSVEMCVRNLVIYYGVIEYVKHTTYRDSYLLLSIHVGVKFIHVYLSEYTSKLDRESGSSGRDFQYNVTPRGEMRLRNRSLIGCIKYPHDFGPLTSPNPTNTLHTLKDSVLHDV